MLYQLVLHLTPHYADKINFYHIETRLLELAVRIELIVQKHARSFRYPSIGTDHINRAESLFHCSKKGAQRYPGCNVCVMIECRTFERSSISDGTLLDTWCRNLTRPAHQLTPGQRDHQHRRSQFWHHILHAGRSVCIKRSSLSRAQLP